ncbi:MAG TPA: hypothetical protein VNA19_10830 [Pyrinomonadaceae bacterium]|nr:hypothetical protein [Pyrinomonadaceae bacterium]
MRNYRRAFLRVALGASVLLLSPVGATVSVGDDAFWASKVFRQWSKDEANRILNASPWAKTQEVRIKPAASRRSVAGQTESSSARTPSTRARQGELGGAQAPVDYKVTLRLRSALPVRQALVRLRQLDAKYDRMNDAQRAAFDADRLTRGLLECPACGDNYVVTLSAKSVNSPGADFIYDGLKAVTLPLLKQTLYLANDRGERRELVHFTPPKAPGEEAMFFFPRLDAEGKPLFTASDKKLLFRTSDSNVTSITNFEFDIATLLLGGEVAF